MTAGFTLTDCLGRPSLDAAGEQLGRVADIEVEASERFPRAVALLLRRGREHVRVPWERVERVDAAGAIVRTPGAGLADDDGRRLLLARDVLDAQVVDLAGKRLARVGDVELALSHGATRVVAVDVGLAPVARRLRLRRLARHLREEWIGWDGVYLASGRGHRVQLEQRAVDVRRLDHDELMALVGHLPPARGAEVIARARPGVDPHPVQTARRARRARRRFRVMRARKRAPS